MAKKYSMEWYKEQEQKDIKLRNKLLKHTKRREGEGASEWLDRVNLLYIEQKKKL